MSNDFLMLVSSLVLVLSVLVIIFKIYFHSAYQGSLEMAVDATNGIRKKYLAGMSKWVLIVIISSSYIVSVII